MSTFVIINSHAEQDLRNHIIGKLPAGSNVILFSDSFKKNDEETNITVYPLPGGFRESESKLRNFVFRKMFDTGVKGFVHVIQDSTEIIKDPSEFTSAIELMMKKLSLKTWLNTSCDECNYVFSKYMPRTSILIDEPEVSGIYSQKINLCSNANFQWMVTDMDTSTFEDVKLNEKFAFPMYFIIEFLARRRNTKKEHEINYMNYYPSVDEEIGVFHAVGSSELHRFSQTDIQNEDRIFHEMKVDNHPDIALEPIFEDIYETLKKNA